MSLADAFAPAEAQYKANVMFLTWGHLYPTPGHKYRGKIVFGVAGYSGVCFILTADWGDLPDSPILFEAMQQVFDKVKHSECGVWEWEGELICYKNQKTRLTKGKVRRIISV
jgi:hypothetical protein